MAVDVGLGGKIYVDVTLHNSGTITGTTYLRVSLVPSGQITGLDLADIGTGLLDAEITLTPGVPVIKSFEGTMPNDSALIGLWKSVAIARTEPDLAGEVLAEVIEEDQVNLVGTFDVQITDVFEYI